MKQIVDIVILYDNEREVYAYAKDLSQQTVKNDIALVIVVNKKGDMQLENFRNELSILPISIFVVEPNENLGYLNGVIYGHKQYCLISESIPKWVVVSNTDIEFRNNTFFEHFLSTNYADDVWCVAPSVYSPKKKSYDNPEYVDRCTKEKLNKLIFIYERPLLAYFYTRLSTIKGMLKRNKKQNSKVIYSAKGCFFIIKNELAIILNDRKFKALLYSEESYIAELIREYNKKTYYDSKIEVIHSESAVTGKLANKKRAKYISSSLLVIRDEFYVSTK